MLNSINLLLSDAELEQYRRWYFLHMCKILLYSVGNSEVVTQLKDVHQKIDFLRTDPAFQEDFYNCRDAAHWLKSCICLQHHDGRIRVWRHVGERTLNSCVMHRYTGPAPRIIVWSGIGYHSHTPLVHIAGTLNSHRYILEVLEPVVFPYLQGLATAIFQQDNARPHVARIAQRFFVNHQIESLPWPARSPDISPVENMWSMVAQRLTQITRPAATPDQLWQRVQAVLSVPQEHIQSLFE
ncbi:transposable element Tcb1 transposase [Trichonephila clavipes]|nr:transposable element Tcb1 transposase [Trichonephila clavipes]